MEIHLFFWKIINLVLNTILFVGGFLFLYTNKKQPIGYYFLATLILQFTTKIFEYIEIPTNLHLFSISYYLNFLYLNFYFFNYIFKINKRIYYFILTLGSLPMIFKLFFWSNIKNFEAYDWIVYDGYLIIFSLLAIFKLIQKKQINKNHLLICFSILGFFGLDFSISFAMNYLVNGTYKIVTWIWQLRAIVLIGYFLTLSICTWKILKKA